MRVLGPFIAAILSLPSTAQAWSLSREAIRPALTQAQDEVRRCAREHAAPNGRYAFWIVVNERGSARTTLRESPAPLSADARRCLERAYEAQPFPAPLAATVAWSAASPPQRTYSISLPITLAVNTYGFGVTDDPIASGVLDGRLLRPEPARSRLLRGRLDLRGRPSG